MSKGLKHRFDGDAPDGPHLVVYTTGWTGMAMPRGCRMGIVMDPTVQDRLHKLYLIEVKADKLVFKCACNPTCTATHTFKRSDSGYHAK